MRIDRLDLRAFGPFTDDALDLSQGNQGLHVVFGPNEAGKSSALRAITQIFYGIPARSKDDFVHQKSRMRIGAAIRNGQNCLNFVRRKGRKSTLRDKQDDKVLHETELQVFLGGLDQDTFRTVFGLHHEQLVEGGRMILDGKGNIGQALFAASAGLSGLRTVMASLQEESGELFKASASKPRINAAISAFRKKKKELKELQLRPEEWTRVDKALSNAEAERVKIEETIESLGARRNRLKRISEALPLTGKRDAILLELTPVAEAILLPEDFQEHRRDLLQEQHQASSDRTQAEGRLETIKSAMKNLSINDKLLAQESLVDELYLRSASNRKAIDDSRQKLQPECRLLEEQTQQALTALRPGWKLEQIETMRISSPQRSHILELGQQKEALDSQKKHAQTQLDRLEAKRKETAAKLGHMKNVSEPDELDRCVRRIQKRGDLEEQLSTKQQEHAIAEGAIESALSRLGLWEGTADDLAKLPVPTQDTISHFRDRLDRQINRLEDLKVRRDELEEEQQSTHVKIEALKREQDVPTEETLHITRNARKSSWQLVRASWEEGTLPGNVNPDVTRKILACQEIPEETVENLADAHEFVTDKADDLSDRLRREADRAAELAQLEAKAIDVDKKVRDIVSEYDGVEKEYAESGDDWKKMWEPLGIEPQSPREMAAWTQNHGALVTQIDTLQSQVIAIDALRDTISVSKGELNGALRAIGEAEAGDSETLVALLDRANDIVSTRRKAVQGREQLEAELESLNREDLPAAKHATEKSSSALEEWHSVWKKAMEELGETVNTPPKKANAIVQEIDELLSGFDKAQGLKRRVDQITQDDENFRSGIAELMKNVTPRLSKLPADQAILALHKELQESKNDSTRLEDLKTQQDDEEVRCRKAKLVLDRVAEDISSLCKEAQVECVDALPDAENRSELRRKLEIALRDVEDRLIELASGKGLNDFLEAVSEEDPDTLGPEILRLNTEISEKEKALKLSSEEIGERRKELRLMDGSAEAVQVADEAQALLASMATDVERYSRLRISELLLARAIEQYREKHQGPLLRRAGELFSALTLGSFRDLTPDFDESGEDTLVGLRADNNTSVLVSGMSDGTTDQLYLALRLASLEQYLEKHPPIPFILDDILINFDDARSVATLEILANLSQRTQVIFFTHHQHLVELAKENLKQDVLFSHIL